MYSSFRTVTAVRATSKRPIRETRTACSRPSRGAPTDDSSNLIMRPVVIKLQLIGKAGQQSGITRVAGRMIPREDEIPRWWKWRYEIGLIISSACLAEKLFCHVAKCAGFSGGVFQFKFPLLTRKLESREIWR